MDATRERLSTFLLYLTVEALIVSLRYVDHRVHLPCRAGCPLPA